MTMTQKEHAQAERAVRAKRKNYTNNEYPRGRGRIKCQICSLPVRDHEGVGPCPFAPPEGLKVSPANRIRGEFT